MSEESALDTTDGEGDTALLLFFEVDVFFEGPAAADIFVLWWWWCGWSQQRTH